MVRILLVLALLAAPSLAPAWEASEMEDSQEADLGNDAADFVQPNDDSQAADLGNDGADRAVIQAPSQAGDLGNDAADYVQPNDDSQEGDLEN